MPEDQLERVYESMNYWHGQVDVLDARLEEIQRIARHLDQGLQPLYNVLGPVRSLHNGATWEGHAATQSRSRLDAHEDRCVAVIRAIHNLIFDLEDQATIVARQASSARGNEQEYRADVSRLEGEPLKNR